MIAMNIMMKAPTIQPLIYNVRMSVGSDESGVEDNVPGNEAGELGADNVTGTEYENRTTKHKCGLQKCVQYMRFLMIAKCIGSNYI